MNDFKLYFIFILYLYFILLYFQQIEHKFVIMKINDDVQ